MTNNIYVFQRHPTGRLQGMSRKDFMSRSKTGLVNNVGSKLSPGREHVKVPRDHPHTMEINQIANLGCKVGSAKIDPSKCFQFKPRQYD